MTLHDWSAPHFRDSLLKSLHIVDPYLCPDLTPIGERNTGPWWMDYVDNELEFARDILGRRHPVSGKLDMWEAQRYITEALFKHRFVVVRSCRKTGKTFNAGRVIIPTFLLTAPSQVLAMAPTMDQVRNVIFGSHIAVAKSSAPVELPGHLSAMSWRLDSEHFALGVPSRNTENIRGHHAGTVMAPDPDDDEISPEDLAKVLEATGKGARRLLIYIDEPQGIDEEIFRVLRGMYASPYVYVLVQGNPYLGLDDDHEYVRACQEGSRWHKVKISAISESEAIELGGVSDSLPCDKSFERVPGTLLPRVDVDEYLRDFELTDPFVLSDVLGRFAEGSTQSLVIPRAILKAALSYEPYQRKLGPKIGIDVGGTGDSTCAVLMYHGCVVGMKEWRYTKDDKSAQVDVATQTQALAVEWGGQLGESFEDWDGGPIPPHRISIDDSGNVGVCDILASREYSVDRVSFGGSSQGQFLELVGDAASKNVRAEMHWVARRGLQEGAFQVPDESEFRRIWQQAQWTHFEREAGEYGPVIKMELKDKAKARHGRSPDCMDAFVLACRQPVAAQFATWESADAQRVAENVARKRNRPRLAGGKRVRM